MLQEQPNGSRLSCGRPARRRKAAGRQSGPRQGHNTPLPFERSPPASFKRLLGGRPTRSAPAIPAAYARPGKDEGEKRKDDGTDVRTLTTSPSVKKAARDDEQANRIKDKEGA